MAAVVAKEELAAAVLAELRRDSPQRRESIFTALCVRFPSRISKGEVKDALLVLAQQGLVEQSSDDVWGTSARASAVGDQHSKGRSVAPSPCLALESSPAVVAAELPVAEPSASRGTPAAPTIEWSTEQRAVIEAPKSDWILVEAGPGTGKTAVACGRVAHLLGQGVPGHAIVMVSFTRTAVTELRERIRRLSTEARGAASVRITTLDSEAWHLGVGFGESPREERLKAGYAANIRDAADKLEAGDPALLEWLAGTQYLLIDEAQDLVGERAELVLRILNRLAEGTGVAVFVDPAQAIYGFSSDVDGEDARTSGLHFDEQLQEQFDFRRLQLTRLFRTTSGALKEVFEAGRQIAVGTQSPKERLERLHGLVDAKCERHGRPDEQVPEEDELVLFRRRSEVLLASSFLSGKGVPHRLRLSQIELGIQPWVGAILGAVSSIRLTEAEFRAAWKTLEHQAVLQSTSELEAWGLLLRAARAPRSDEVDVRALRRVLSTGRPPPEFCLTEAGLKGPILGTIHASKGRESARVRMMLTDRRGDSPDLEEEVRVDYVGATRARVAMSVGEGYAAYGLCGLKGAGGRLQRIGDKRKHAAMVEVGRPDDLEAASPVSRAFQTSSTEARKLQEKLLAYDGAPVELQAIKRTQPPWTYLLCDETRKTWGALSQRVNQDLLTLRLGFPDGERLVPPEDCRHLHLIGVRTVVLAEGDARLAGLYEPWASQGVFLAPVVKALTTVYFRFKSRSRGVA